MKYIKNYQIIVPTVIIISYILFRFWNLTASCLFFDEIFSIHAAKHSWDSLLWFVAQDLIHPPLFYILLKSWILIGGESLFWLRLFPVVFSVAALIPFCLLGRELKLNYWSFVLAITFFAVNGSLIKYSQEIRMYSVLLCFALFSIWLFVRILNQNKGLIWFLLVNILLVNSHYFGWLVVISQLIAVIILRREKLKQILLVIGLTGLSSLPWIFQVWQAAQINADFKQNLGWAEKPALTTLFHFLNDLFEPFYFQQTNIDRAETLLITVPLIFICLISSLLYFLDWKEEIEKEQMILLLILLKVPILLALIASWILPVSIWGTRHLIITFPLIIIYFSIVLGKINVRELKITFISITFLLISLAFLLQLTGGNQKLVWCAWEEMAVDFEQMNNSQKAKLYVFEDLVAYHVWSGLQAKQTTQIIVVKGIEELLEDKAYFLPRGFDEIKVTDEAGIEGERFWIAFRDSAFSESHQPVKNLLLKGYKIGEPKTFEAQGIKTFLVEIKK